jgi:uncharacterized membrane protein YqgA involved in biofilm formation
MFLLGTIVNSAAVVLGGTLGTFLKKGIPDRIRNAVMSAIGLFIVYLGVSGSLVGKNALVAVLSLAIGTVIGELIDIDKRINSLGDLIQSKLKGKNGAQISISEGFVACTILFCVGSMAILGAMDDAKGNPDTLFAKAILDGISAFVMATTLGIGCALSAVSVFLYQGSISVLALLVLSELPVYMLNEISCVGSLIIIAIGTNMLGVTKIKTANLIPAMFLPLLLCLFM